MLSTCYTVEGATHCIRHWDSRTQCSTCRGELSNQPLHYMPATQYKVTAVQPECLSFEQLCARQPHLNVVQLWQHNMDNRHRQHARGSVTVVATVTADLSSCSICCSSWVTIEP